VRQTFIVTLLLLASAETRTKVKQMHRE